MFRKLLYPLRVNIALAAVNIPPTLINQEYRQGIQAMGWLAGAKPEEVAVSIVSQLPLAHQTNISYEVIRLWIEDGKIDVTKPDVRVPLDNLGIYL